MKMGWTRVGLALTAALLLAASPGFAAGGMMQAGQWEITSSTEIEGMAHHMPPSTFTHCVKPEDVKDPESMVRKSQQSKSECELKDVKVDGNRVTWSVECRERGHVKGTGTMVYSGDSYEGTITMQMEESQRGPMKITTHIKGRRVGDCK